METEFVKIYELNKFDRFRFVVEGMTFDATFYKMDGMYAQVQIDGHEQIELLHYALEVMKL